MPEETRVKATVEVRCGDCDEISTVELEDPKGFAWAGHSCPNCGTRFDVKVEVEED